MPFGTDQILWYNNGVWGQLGFACPNYGNDPTTVNGTIAYLVDVVGRNLFAMMNHTDASLRVPPSLNTLTRVHKLCVRARTILDGRDVAPGQLNMEPQHASPAREDFIVYPVPYFKIRNRWIKEWAGYILMALSEAMQHTENRKPIEISTTFSGLVGQYIQRVYRLMSVELLGIPVEMAAAANFTLSDAQLAAFDPNKWFTSTEMVDTVPPLDQIPTEDDLDVLGQGLAASQLVGLAKWPSGSGVPFGAGSADAVTSGATTGSGSTSFAPPPSP